MTGFACEMMLRAGATSVFNPLMMDGTIDLAIFETYTRYTQNEYYCTASCVNEFSGLTRGRILHREWGDRATGINSFYPELLRARAAGWINRSIVCLGFMYHST